LITSSFQTRVGGASRWLPKIESGASQKAKLRSGAGAKEPGKTESHSLKKNTELPNKKPKRTES